MIIFKLNSSFLPDLSLTKFETFIWRERYQNNGDFQIIVEDDISILNRFPRGSLISHTDTNEVMMVENHQIVRDKNKKLKVTVSGRSFETFAENRATERSGFPLYDPATLVKDPDATYTGSAESVAVTLLQKALQSGTANSNDVVANLLVRSVLRDPDAAMTHVIKRGDVYGRVIDLLRLSDSGIKVLRPNGAQTTLDVVIYDGLDKTATVVFSAQYADLSDAQYFWSDKGFKNFAAIATHTAYRFYQDRDTPGSPTGLNRRTLYVEDDSILGDFTSPSSTDIVASTAQSALNEHPQISLMQATVSNTAKPKFKINYDIGDLVTVYGEFGLAQAMRVTEHILTEDKNGIRGYPSLSAL